MSKNQQKAMRSTDQSTRIANQKVPDNLQVQYNDNTKLCSLSNELRNKLLALIGAGEENAIHLIDLIKLTGLGNRELRKYIELLRRDGIVIISNKNGYFRPLRDEETKQYIKQETRRAKSIFYTLKAARNWLNKNKT